MTTEPSDDAIPQDPVEGLALALALLLDSVKLALALFPGQPRKGSAVEMAESALARWKASRDTAPDRAALAWTRDKPTVPGWYWMRLVEPAFAGHCWDERPVEARIDPRSGRLEGIDGVGTWEYAGPLPGPPGSAKEPATP